MFKSCPRCGAQNDQWAIFCSVCLGTLTLPDQGIIPEPQWLHESARSTSQSHIYSDYFNPLCHNEFIHLRWSSIHWAVYEDHIEIVRLLICGGMNVNCRTESGETPLHFAKSRAIARILLAGGAEVNATNNKGETPVFYIIRLNLRRVLEYLISRGAEIHVQNHHGLTLLHRAAREGSLEMVRILLRKGAIVNARDAQGRTPLFSARTRDIALLLIAGGADINATDHHGWTPLKCVKLTGSPGEERTEVIELFRQFGGRE